MENKDLKPIVQTQEKEIDLFELMQKTWKFVVKWSSTLLYRLIRFIIFSIRNIHWLILATLVGVLVGYFQFSQVGKIYEASSVLYLPHENVLLCIREIENTDLLLRNSEFEKLVQDTELTPTVVSNILSIDYAYGVVVEESTYPNYFVENFDYSNKKNEKLSTNYLQITIKTKELFSEDSIQMILRSLLVKNEYFKMITQNYLEQQQEFLLLLDKEIVKSQQAAEVELTKRQQISQSNNIVLSLGIDTTTLARPLKLQREKLDLQYKLKLYKKGNILFVNDFYFTKVINSILKYSIRWGLYFILITYGVLFFLKRKKYIKLFIQKVQTKTI